MRALTALKQAGKAPQETGGRPPEMPLAKIVKDPDNPRPPPHKWTQEEKQKQNELNESVRRRGIKSPVSLRPHPANPDFWMINHGHCRYDAAVAAGLTTIPYFVDPNFDSYDQIAENMHRSDLSIWAIASFIKRKLDEGQSKTEVAQRLNKDGLNFVTEHLALVEAPGCLHHAYANSVRSPRTLYDLRRAHDEFPEQVDAWCHSGVRITRDSIKELIDGLRHDVIARASGGPSGSGTEVPGLEESVVPALRGNEGSKSSVDQDGNGCTQVPRVHRRAERTESTALGDAGISSQRMPESSACGDGIRHDVIFESATVPLSLYASQGQEPITPSGTAGPEIWRCGKNFASGMRVLYRGQPAKVLAESRVTILVEGSERPIEVLLADVELDGAA